MVFLLQIRRLSAQDALIDEPEAIPDKQ